MNQQTNEYIEERVLDQKTIDAFMGRVIKTESCWIWAGARQIDGYGRFYVSRRNSIHETQTAHKISFLIFKGKVPAGLQIDHICNNPPCVNPDHLQALTPRENTLRSNAITAKQARQTHCKRGHEFTSENTRIKGTHRYCRTCDRQRMREYKRRATLSTMRQEKGV